jgi:rhamnosyltransferase
MVDIIIPVYRPDDKLEKLIDKLNEQTVQPEHIFFMQTLTGTEEDSRVRKILNRARRGEIHTLDKKDFDHGGTRNRGAALSEAEYMLFMTQDAVPVDERLVEKLLDAMTPETVAAAYGRQLAGEDAGVIENYTRQFNYPPESSRKSAADLPRLGIKTYFCSNVCAMYKKKVYDELGGFVLHTIFNEDMIMASKVIGAGYQIAYCGEAAVVHSHKYTYRQQFSRNFDLAVSQRQYREIFDNVKSETEGIRMVKDTAKYLLSQGKWFLVPDLIFQSGFKFLGYRFGKKYDRLPMWMVRRFSMNKAYWRESE